jgi:hypothetical protein
MKLTYETPFVQVLSLSTEGGVLFESGGTENFDPNPNPGTWESGGTFKDTFLS